MLRQIYNDHGIDLELEQIHVKHTHKPFFETSIAGGEAAITLWQKLRDLHSQTGYWPLITGELTAQVMFEHTPFDAESMLKKAEAYTAEQFFEENKDLLEGANDEEDWEEMQALIQEQTGGDLDSSNMISPKTGYSSLKEVLSGNEIPELNLLLLPIEHPWQMAAYLCFGGWNACPMPEWQVCLHARWYQKFGAEPVFLTGSVLEMHASRPPKTEAGALQLAKEQLMYCDDLVFQGVMTLDNLAATLIGSEYWYFWWD